MKLELDLDELYAEHRGHTPADIVRDEVERLIREMVREAVQSQLHVAREEVQGIVTARLRTAILLAADEIDSIEDDELVRSVL